MAQYVRLFCSLASVTKKKQWLYTSLLQLFSFNTFFLTLQHCNSPYCNLTQRKSSNGLVQELTRTVWVLFFWKIIGGSGHKLGGVQVSLAVLVRLVWSLQGTSGKGNV